MADAARKEERREPRRDSKSERSRNKDDSDDETRNAGRRDNEKSSRRDSRKSSRSDRKEKLRSVDEHHAALPQNQFPGAVPDQYTKPYRPPGLASDYYGDQGESVSFQPGVRPNPPSIIHNADQAHLMEPTAEAKPPQEPSSLGQLGAAASFFAMDANTSDAGEQSTPTKPGRKPSRRSSKPINQQSSPRGSPGPVGRISGSMAGGAIGAAADYYSGNFSTSNGPAPTSNGSMPNGPPRTDSPESYADGSRPPRPSGMGSQSGSHHYGSAAATGVAGAAAGAYLLNQHHQSQSQQNSAYYANRPDPNFALGQNQSAFPQMQQRRRQKRRGPVGKFINWFKDPDGVAEFEQYTEAIGVCRDCFDPNSSPLDAPRKHHYHHHRQSGSRHGSTTRVDKAYRYSSDEEKRRGSSTKKVVVGGLAGYGVAKVGEAIYKQNHDFDDTYSVKSGRPANRSRVSFKEDGDRYTTRRKSKYGSNEDVRLERRESGRKSRKEEERYEKQSSRRRGSSSSSSTHGMSRGAALSLGAGAAGLAMGVAAAQERRKSRSRSRSPSKRKKSYYSKTISPTHSYVDLNATKTGALGLGGFFSPSANKKGKKSKGFFSFRNASSSSSDADLAFGEGTVRRKSGKRGRSDEKEDHNYGSTAALMGLAATGAALAAESDRRKSKGKDSRYTDDRPGRDPRRTSAGKIKLNDHETTTDGENDDAWEDASDDDNSSIDTALAYGGRLSAAQSRESLTQGTDNWDWRWKKNKEKRRSRRDSQPEPPQSFDSGTAAMIGTGISAAAAATMMSEASTSVHKPGSLPPMQRLDPVPTEDPNFFGVQRSSVISGVFPGSSVPPPQHFATSEPVPLQQPQPVLPIGAIPGAFDGVIEDRRRTGRDSDRRTRTRRDSSPAKFPSRESRSNVSFAIPDEDLEKEQRRTSRREEKERRKSADAVTLSSGISKDGEDIESKAEAERRAAREAEIEAELERLHEEDRRRTEGRKQKDEQRKRKVEVAGVAAAAAAVGAGMAASVIAGQAKRSDSSERERPVRKSSMKKTKTRSDSPAAETQQERIARMAAQRVRSTPSPVHDDYSTFFTPTEIAEHVKEHNDASAHRDDPDPQVVEIVPGRRKKKATPFDDFNYRPFGVHPDDDPTAYPWPVPALGLLEPTPPGSLTHTPRGPSPVSEAPKEKEFPDDDFGEKLERRESRVKWGEDDINVYEVMTPEYERSDFIMDSPQKVEIPTKEVPPADFPEIGSRQTQANFKSKLSRAWTIDDDDDTVVDQKVSSVEEITPEQRNHAAKGKGFNDLPQSDDGTRARDFATGGNEPTPTVDLEDLFEGQKFYQSPFSETVSDLGDLGPQPKKGPSFIEDTKPPGTPKGGVSAPTPEDIHAEERKPSVENVPSGPRMSKSERRRMERGMSSTEAVPSEITSERAEEPSTRESDPSIPTSKSVFDYLVDDEGKSLPPASALGVAASSVLSNGQTTRDVPTSAEPRAFKKQ